MCVLSNREIEKAISAGELAITPQPAGVDAENSHYDEISIGISLGEHMYKPLTGCQLAFDLKEPGKVKDTLDKMYEKVRIESGGYVLQPGYFLLADSKEKIYLSDKLCARIEGRSRFARLGLLVHATAPTIQAGFGRPKTSTAEKGATITFELKNIGRFPIILREGAIIGQLIVESVHGEVYRGAGEFDSQLVATGK